MLRICRAAETKDQPLVGDREPLEALEAGEHLGIPIWAPGGLPWGTVVLRVWRQWCHKAAAAAAVACSEG